MQSMVTSEVQASQVKYTVLLTPGSCWAARFLCKAELVTSLGFGDDFAGPRGKAIDLDEDLDGLEADDSGDTRVEDDLLGDRGLDDLIGAGFSPGRRHAPLA